MKREVNINEVFFSFLFSFSELFIYFLLVKNGVNNCLY